MSKHFLRSKTIWGAIIGILPNVFIVLGWEIPPGWIESLHQAGLGLIDTVLNLANLVNEVVGLFLVLYGRAHANQPIRIGKAKPTYFSAVAAAVLASFLFTGCAQSPTYSSDPYIQNVQKWRDSCRQMGQVIQTAIILYQAGQLTPGEAAVVDRVDQVFRPVCTSDPGPLDEAIKDAAIQQAVGELCPELMAQMIDDHLVTVTQAAACAARRALLLQLEAPST